MKDRIIVPIYLPKTVSGWLFIIALVFIIGVIAVNSVFAIAEPWLRR